MAAEGFLRFGAAATNSRNLSLGKLRGPASAPISPEDQLCKERQIQHPLPCRQYNIHCCSQSHTYSLKSYIFLQIVLLLGTHGTQMKSCFRFQISGCIIYAGPKMLQKRNEKKKNPKQCLPTAHLNIIMCNLHMQEFRIFSSTFSFRVG